MENTLKTVVSFEYADAGKKSVFIVKANSVEPNCCEVLSEMTPGLMLGGGIVTELDENGQEVSEHSTSQIAIPPCFDSYPDELVSAVLDMVSRGETVDPASGKTGLVKVLEACEEFQKLADSWTDRGNIAFMLDGRPVQKEISNYSSYCAIVGATKERLYYKGLINGDYICLDTKTRTCVSELDGKEEETMMEDLHAGKMLWYTPGFPYLAEEARFGCVASDQDDTDEKQDEAPGAELQMVVELEMLSLGDKLTFKISGNNIRIVMPDENGHPSLAFDNGKVETMKEGKYIPFTPNNGFTPVSVVQDIVDRVVRGEVGDKDELISLARIIRADPAFEKVIESLAPKENLFMEIAGRKIPRRIVYSNPSVEGYSLMAATECVLYYLAENGEDLLMVRASNGAIITENTAMAEGSFYNDQENNKLIYKADNIKSK